MHDKENIIEAIASYLAGVATEEDLRFIAAWRMKSGRNEAFYQRVTNEDLLEKDLEELRQEDVRVAWERAERVMRRRPREVYRVARRIASVAAAVVAVSLTWWMLSRAPGERRGETGEETGSPATTVQLVLSDGTTIPINESNSTIIRDGAGAVIHQEDGHLDYSRNNTPRDTMPLFNEIIMGNGMAYTTTLSDGTRVSLNAETKLRFPVTFTGRQRVVEFEGEGYFEVVRDADHPFIIRVEGMEVTVLGTEFNLRAYSDEPVIETTLVEGSVQVSNGKRECRIVPGEQSLYERENGTITTRQVDVTLYTAWHHNEIKFKDMPLEEVMRGLARWYGIRYEFLDDASRRIEFGGCFNRFDRIDPILDMLRRTDLVEVVVRDERVCIAKKK